MDNKIRTASSSDVMKALSIGKSGLSRLNKLGAPRSKVRGKNLYDIQEMEVFYLANPKKTRVAVSPAEKLQKLKESLISGDVTVAQAYSKLSNMNNFRAGRHWTEARERIIKTQCENCGVFENGDNNSIDRHFRLSDKPTRMTVQHIDFRFRGDLFDKLKDTIKESASKAKVSIAKQYGYEEGPKGGKPWSVHYGSLQRSGKARGLKWDDFMKKFYSEEKIGEKTSEFIESLKDDVLAAIDHAIAYLDIDRLSSVQAPSPRVETWCRTCAWNWDLPYATRGREVRRVLCRCKRGFRKLATRRSNEEGACLVCWLERGTAHVKRCVSCDIKIHFTKYKYCLGCKNGPLVVVVPADDITKKILEEVSEKNVSAVIDREVDDDFMSYETSPLDTTSQADIDFLEATDIENFGMFCARERIQRHQWMYLESEYILIDGFATVFKSLSEGAFYKTLNLLEEEFEKRYQEQ